MTILNKRKLSFSFLIKIFLIQGFFTQTFFTQALAHHTKDHLMLQADPDQIIAATEQGVLFPWSWLVWFLVFFLISIGIIRQWKK
jgi:hypothetical protein